MTSLTSKSEVVAFSALTYMIFPRFSRGFALHRVSPVIRGFDFPALASFRSVL